MSEPRLTVIIPTFRRTAGLERAVESVFAQDVLSHEPACLILVDNDPDGSALPLARDLAERAPDALSVRVIHAPEPGVANARNAAMAAVETRLVACLDDDQSAPEGWLSALLATHAAHPAAATFGPVDTRLPETVRHHQAYFRDFFARQFDAPEGPIETFFGCGNCLLDRPRLPRLDPLFDPAMNETGGEDDLLFRAIRETGGGFAWSPDAAVFEHVPAARARLGYTLRRAVAYGQGPIMLARAARPPRYMLMMAWWLIGAGQALVFGAAAAAAFVLRRPNRARWLDRAARGFGKVIWWRDLRFYGASQIPVSVSHLETGRAAQA